MCEVACTWLPGVHDWRRTEDIVSKLNRALSELQTMRALVSQSSDSALRANLLAKINEVERLVKGARPAD